MAETNKVKFGLSNVHVGTVTVAEDEVAFGAPTAYPGAVSLTLDVEGDTSPFYADNIVYFTTTTNNGYSGDLEMAYLYDWFETQFLNSETSQEGMIVEKAENLPKAMYLMYQFEGDVNATKHILYNVLPGRPSIEGNTKEDTTEPTTTTIPITAMPLATKFGNIVKAKVPSTASNYATFFDNAPAVPTKQSEQNLMAKAAKKTA